MARTHPFFRHVHHVTGIMARAPEPERYPYHDQTECPVGQRVKQSGDWQYYLGRPGEERAHCSCCVALGATPTANAPASSAPNQHEGAADNHCGSQAGVPG